MVCSLDEDRSRALDRARELVTQYLGQQPHIMKASGVDQSLLDEIGQVLTWPAGPDGGTPCALQDVSLMSAPNRVQFSS